MLSCDIENFFCNCPIARFSCVYRPPNFQLQYSLSFLKALETEIAPLKANFPVIVMGDINLTKIEWVTHRPTLNYTTADAQLILTSQRIHLIQKVLSPRHNNITDLLFVSDDNNLLTNVSVGMPFSTSDHNTIYFDLLKPTPLHLSATPSFVTNLHQRLDFTKIDYAGFSSTLLTTDWRQCFSLCDSIDTAWDNLSALINSLIIKFTPIKYSSSFKNKPLLPHNILILIRQKHAAWKINRNRRTVNNKKFFCRLLKTVRSSILALRKAREENILSSGSIKLFYKYTRSRMHPSNSIGPLKNADGNLIAGDLNKAELFNNFSHSVYTNDDSISPHFNKRTDKLMPIPTFTVNEIRTAIAKIKNSTSCGPDGCPPIFFKKFPELCVPLCDLFNMSIQQGIVSKAWKIANVIPIFKGKGSALDVKNYRPISLTNVFCKTLEKLIRNRIIEYLENNHLLSPCQSGFRAGSSTLTQLTKA